MNARVRIDVMPGDVLEHDTDILALKYAQGLHGVDLKVVERLEAAGSHVMAKLPAVGEGLLISSNGGIAAAQVLLIGVQPLGHFAYGEIRQFSRAVMRQLAEAGAAPRHVTLTLHGRGYGLDEGEAFKAELAGLLDAFEANEYPLSLQHINVVENDARTAERLKLILDELFPEHVIAAGKGRERDNTVLAASHVLRDVGDASKKKPSVFVAMPFEPALADRFHYGIENAVNSAGYLCERADLSSFTGDVLSWVRERIDNAEFVVADLSTANPNVYLEVGYAWRRGVPTVLIVSSASELKFDVRGQRCLIFESIRQLEELLSQELVALRAGLVPA